MANDFRVIEPRSPVNALLTVLDEHRAREEKKKDKEESKKLRDLQFRVAEQGLENSASVASRADEQHRWNMRLNQDKVDNAAALKDFYGGDGDINGQPSSDWIRKAVQAGVPADTIKLLGEAGRRETVTGYNDAIAKFNNAERTPTPEDLLRPNAPHVEDAATRFREGLEQSRMKSEEELNARRKIAEGWQRAFPPPAGAPARAVNSTFDIIAPDGSVIRKGDKVVAKGDKPKPPRFKQGSDGETPKPPENVVDFIQLYGDPKEGLRVWDAALGETEEDVTALKVERVRWQEMIKQVRAMEENPTDSSIRNLRALLLNHFDTLRKGSFGIAAAKELEARFSTEIGNIAIRSYESFKDWALDETDPKRFENIANVMQKSSDVSEKALDTLLEDPIARLAIELKDSGVVPAEGPKAKEVARKMVYKEYRPHLLNQKTRKGTNENLGVIDLPDFTAGGDATKAAEDTPVTPDVTSTRSRFNDVPNATRGVTPVAETDNLFARLSAEANPQTVVRPSPQENNNPEYFDAQIHDAGQTNDADVAVNYDSSKIQDKEWVNHTVDGVPVGEGINNLRQIFAEDDKDGAPDNLVSITYNKNGDTVLRIEGHDASGFVGNMKVVVPLSAIGKGGTVDFKQVKYYGKKDGQPGNFAHLAR